MGFSTATDPRRPAAAHPGLSAGGRAAAAAGRSAAQHLRAALSGDDGRRPGRRPADRHDPACSHSAGDERPELLKVGCAGRITSYAETPDDRLLITLTGVCRFHGGARRRHALPAGDGRFPSLCRRSRLRPGRRRGEPPRPAQGLPRLSQCQQHEGRLGRGRCRPTEVLVNTLSLLAPYPPQEKQALLEAPDLKTRADVLVALTEMALSRMGPGGKPRLQ